MLLLHLKRFVFVEKPRPADDGGGDENAHPNSPSARKNPVVADYVFQKNKSCVDILPELSLAPYCRSKEEQKTTMMNTDEATTTQEYELQGIVHHIGARASSGHYTADALRTSLDDDPPSEESEAKSEKEPKDNVIVLDDKDDAASTHKDNVIVVDGNDDAVPTHKDNGDHHALQWTAFDDGNSGRTSMQKIRDSKFKQKTAYMLLYRLKENDTCTL
jgi:hypothetical protein